MRYLIEVFRHIWSHEDDIHMKKVAHRYAERALMDGHVIKKTGEVIPKESA
jgi:uncharacterized protein YihD (DUF1040 family)